jgi:hypothetical protein
MAGKNALKRGLPSRVGDTTLCALFGEAHGAVGIVAAASNVNLILCQLKFV